MFRDLKEVIIKMNPREQLEKRLKDRENKLRRIKSRKQCLRHEIDELAYELSNMEDKEYDVKREIDELKTKIGQVKGISKCPYCGYVYPRHEIEDNIDEDEWGVFWTCPDITCQKKAYLGEGGGLCIPSVMMKYGMSQFVEKYLSSVITLDNFN